MKIGVIGYGFVGKAIVNAYQLKLIETIVVDPKYNNLTIKDLIDQSPDAIFVAVPSPSNQDGSCNTSILEDVTYQLTSYKGLIISKVTAPPDTYESLSRLYPNLVFSPEFLTARNANQDYVDAKFAIVGASSAKLQHAASSFIKLGQPKVGHWMFVDSKTASLAKYAINSFLATKVIFLNQLHHVCQQAGIEYNDLRDCIMLDQRMGTSHFNVPGFNNTFGFGGACFPKDTAALLHYANTLNLNLDVLKSAVDVNNKIWSEYEESLWSGV